MKNQIIERMKEIHKMQYNVTDELIHWKDTKEYYDMVTRHINEYTIILDSIFDDMYKLDDMLLSLIYTNQFAIKDDIGHVTAIKCMPIDSGGGLLKFYTKHTLDIVTTNMASLLALNKFVLDQLELKDPEKPDVSRVVASLLASLITDNALTDTTHSLFSNHESLSPVEDIMESLNKIFNDSDGK